MIRGVTFKCRFQKATRANAMVYLAFFTEVYHNYPLRYFLYDHFIQLSDRSNARRCCQGSFGA